MTQKMDITANAHCEQRKKIIAKQYTPSMTISEPNV